MEKITNINNKDSAFAIDNKEGIKEENIKH